MTAGRVDQKTVPGALRALHSRVKALEATAPPSGSSGVFFNNANTSLPSRGLVVVANAHNVSTSFPGTANRPGIALVSGDSYGMLLSTTSGGAQLWMSSDVFRYQISDPSIGFFVVELSDGTDLFEVDAAGNVYFKFLTAVGDIVYTSAAGGGLGQLARRAIGSTNQVLTVSGGVPTWAASAKSVLTNTGDLLYASAANTLARRAIGSTGDVLYANAGVPIWADITALVQTLFNKRIIPRTKTITSSATPSLNTDDYDNLDITALATNITSFTTNLTGFPFANERLHISITDNGTPRTFVWGSGFESSTVALPAGTTASTRMDIEFIQNAVTSKWRVISVA